MDKIDEWMKRAFDEEPSKSKEEKPRHTGRKPFRKGKPGEKNTFSKKKNFHQKQTRQVTLKSESKHKKQTRHPFKGEPKHGHHKKTTYQGRHKKFTHAGGSHQKQPASQRPIPKAPKPAPRPKTPILRGKLKIIPLGGLGEVGKNLMVLEYEDDIMIIDMGFEFPGEDMLGIDYIIPDVSYLEENKKRIRGVVITHGHLDHTGGIPYILPKLGFPPVYATKLTIGLIKKRVEEFKQEKMTQLRVINPDEPLKLGKFLCRFFRVSHSIPDAIGISIDTPVGKVVHTGDFKFDNYPPRNQRKADMHKIEALGKQNVLALFCESTNALKHGHSMSERDVSQVIDNVVETAPGRLIVASFASQMGRIQQIIDAAKKHKRKIFVSGRSMRENIKISANLGYLDLKGTEINDIKKYKKVPDKEVLILTTGSQGETVSALTRMANKDHPHVKVRKGDTIVLSSSPIIGNERAIFTVINNLSILGARVIHNEIMDVHTSGHAKQEELIKMINYVKPKYLIPIHGEYYMRQALVGIAKKHCGLSESHIKLIQNGDVLVAEKNKITESQEKVDAKYILIDGRGEGHIGSHVQVNREMMSQNGALIILIHIDRKSKKLKKTPDIVSRGFIYMHESQEIVEEITKVAGEAYKNIHKKNPGANRKDLKKYVKQTVDKYTRKKLERRPLIIPLIIEN